MELLNTWHLVETLIPGEMTVVSSGGKTREWSSVERLSPAPDISIRGLVRITTETGASQKVTGVSKRKQREYFLHTIPVLGPSGEVHGVQVWVGDTDGPTTPPRTVSGIAWHLTRSVITQTLEASTMSGVHPEDHVPQRTPAEYTAKAVKFDDAENLFAAALMPEHGRRWDAPMSVLHADGRVMNWHCWARGRTDGDNLGLRLLWHDVTDTVPPAMPTLKELGLPSALESAKTCVAVFDALTGTLTMWLPEAPSWVQWRDVPSGRDIIHADDRICFVQALRKWGHDTGPVMTTVRMRALAEGGLRWQPVSIELRQYPGQLSDRLILAVVPSDLQAPR